MAKRKKTDKQKRVCLNCNGEMSNSTPTVYKCCDACREGVTDIGIVQYPLHYHDCGGGRHVIRKHIGNE